MEPSSEGLFKFFVHDSQYFWNTNFYISECYQHWLNENINLLESKIVAKFDVGHDSEKLLAWYLLTF
jgi:hypothetical protein